jgi:hypothetical protein
MHELRQTGFVQSVCWSLRVPQLQRLHKGVHFQFSTDDKIRLPDITLYLVVGLSCELVLTPLV